MTLIAIDVGTNNLAASVFYNSSLQYYSMIQNKPKTAKGEKLLNIEKYLRKLFEIEKPDYIVYEGSFWNPHEARGYSNVSAAIGIITMMAWKTRQIEPVQLQPSTVKKLVTGSGRASKEQVAQAVKDRYGTDENLPDHITDSVAIGHAFLMQTKDKVK